MTRFVRYGLLLLATLFAGCAPFENAMYDFRGLPPGKVAIMIDLTSQYAYLYAGHQKVLASPISTGREGYDTAPGKYEVIEKDADHRSSLYGAYVRDGLVVQPDVNRHKDPRPPGA